MPPEPTSVEDMVEALRQADKPVLDAKALGERVGLSAYTIRDRRGELEEDGRVGSMEIGQATVWYYDDPNSDTPAPDTADVVDEYGEDLSLPSEGEAEAMAAQTATMQANEVAQTLTSATFWSGYAAVMMVFAQATNLLLGNPINLPGAAWGQIATVFLVATFAVFYLALNAEREARTNRFLPAFWAGTIGRVKGRV